MGFFSRKKKKQDEVTLNTEYKGMTLENALSFTTGEVDVNPEIACKLTREICEQILAFRSMQEETKEEFTIVTEYLSDIQRIEWLNEKDKVDVIDTARVLVNLDEERFKFQNSERKVPHEIRRCFNIYESEIPTRMREMQQRETYLGLINDDMRNLEGEKGAITYEKNQAIKQKEFLKKASFVVLTSAVVIFIILILLMTSLQVDLVIPFFVTGLAAVAFVAYYFVTTANCKSTISMCDRKLNRATQLTNKVKIKLVNTTSVLEYSYEKYHVKDYREMAAMWQEYMAEKDAERRYKRSTQLVIDYQKELTEKLQKNGVIHTDNWVNQPTTFLSKGELYDFKDGIGKRQRRLRTQIDFNQRQQNNSMGEILALKKKYPQFEDRIDGVVREMLGGY